MNRILSFIVFIFSISIQVCFAQESTNSIYGSFHYSGIEMLQLLQDKSFLLISGTNEYRGTYLESNNISIDLTLSQGGHKVGTLVGDTLRIDKKILVLWKEGTTAASFLSSFLKYSKMYVNERAEIRRDIFELSRIAKEYRTRTGSYSGFVIPDDFNVKKNVAFATRVSPEKIILKGTSTRTELDGAIEVTILEDGKPTYWTYFGDFQ